MKKIYVITFLCLLVSCAAMTPNPNIGERTADAMYSQGKYKEMVEWMLPNAEKGAPWAMTKMGQAYELGNGVEQDFKKAMSWYCKVVSLGEDSAWARGDLAPIGKPGHFRKNAHVAAAQIRVGTMYAIGKGRAVDFKKAYQWYSYVMSKYGNLTLYGVPLSRQLDYAKSNLSSEEIAEIDNFISTWQPSCE